MASDTSKTAKITKRCQPAHRVNVNVLLSSRPITVNVLREQGLGAKAIISSYPKKGWKLCCRFSVAVTRCG